MTDNIFSFSATEMGYNHIKAEPSKVCEDASGFYDDDQMHICVVADGHGSDNYPRTDRGSQFAVDAAIEQIKAFVGSISEPIPWDENCQMNVTTSICDSDASDEFRFFVTDEKPSAVFCGSDGIDDSYANVEEMYALYRSILKIFVEHGIEVGKSEIKEYLPVLTKRGSGDDVSIALIMDIQRVTELTPVFTVQTELFNLENQLKEKQHTAAINEEKEKALTSKMSAMMRPGIRTPLDHQIYNQINELRVTMTQMDEEILTLQRKVDNLKLRMPNVVAQCEPGMTEVDDVADNDTAVKAEENTSVQETVAAEYVEIAARAEKAEDAANVNKEVVEEGQNIVSEQSAATEETTVSEPQKIVISEKTVTIAEQMAKVFQMAEQTVVDGEAEGGTKASAAETPEE